MRGNDFPRRRRAAGGAVRPGLPGGVAAGPPEERVLRGVRAPGRLHPRQRLPSRSTSTRSSGAAPATSSPPSRPSPSRGTSPRPRASAPRARSSSPPTPVGRAGDHGHPLGLELREDPGGEPRHPGGAEMTVTAASSHALRATVPATAVSGPLAVRVGVCDAIGPHFDVTPCPRRRHHQPRQRRGPGLPGPDRHRDGRRLRHRGPRQRPPRDPERERLIGVPPRPPAPLEIRC